MTVVVTHERALRVMLLLTPEQPIGFRISPRLVTATEAIPRHCGGARSDGASGSASLELRTGERFRGRSCGSKRD